MENDGRGALVLECVEASIGQHVTEALRKSQRSPVGLESGCSRQRRQSLRSPEKGPACTLEEQRRGQQGRLPRQAAGPMQNEQWGPGQARERPSSLTTASPHYR